jgi:glycine/D-amino acid oxidase-like deaminating enzyme
MQVFRPVTWSSLGAGPWRPPEPPTSASLPPRTEWCVIGAGLTGLTAAAVLASGGRDVVLLDRRFGDGAACRSGGIIVGDTLAGPASDFDGCEIELRDWVRRHAPHVDLQWTGCMELDRNSDLPASPIDWRDHGSVRRRRVVEGGTLDPARLVKALGAHAVASGARFVNGAAVSSLRTAGNDVRVELQPDRRPILASRVLIATEAASASSPFNPWPIRHFTVAIETEPLPDDRFSAIGWNDRQPFYTNDLPLLWGRVLDEGRLLAGRELLSLDELQGRDLGAAIDDAGRKVAARLRGLHPALADVGLRRVWAGPIGRDASAIPGIHQTSELPHVWWAGGYAGHGLAQAFRLGRLAAKRFESI